MGVFKIIPEIIIDQPDFHDINSNPNPVTLFYCFNVEVKFVIYYNERVFRTYTMNSRSYSPADGLRDCFQKLLDKHWICETNMLSDFDGFENSVWVLITDHLPTDIRITVEAIFDPKQYRDMRLMIENE